MHDADLMSPAAASKPPVSAATAEFGRRVRERQTALGLTQEELAHESQLHWSYIGQVERGRTNLTLHNLLRLAFALGVDPATLVSGLEPAGPPQG